MLDYFDVEGMAPCRNKHFFCLNMLEGAPVTALVRVSDEKNCDVMIARIDLISKCYESKIVWLKSSMHPIDRSVINDQPTVVHCIAVLSKEVRRALNELRRESELNHA